MLHPTITCKLKSGEKRFFKTLLFPKLWFCHFCPNNLCMTGKSIQFAAKQVLVNRQNNLMIFNFTIFPSKPDKIQINIYAFLNHFSIYWLTTRMYFGQLIHLTRRKRISWPPTPSSALSHHAHFQTNCNGKSTTFSSILEQVCQPHPSLFTHMQYKRVDEGPTKNKTSSPAEWLCMRFLKNEFTEDGTYHNLTTYTFHFNLSTET